MNRKITLSVSEASMSRDHLLEFLQTLKNQVSDLPISAKCDFDVRVEVVEP